MTLNRRGNVAQIDGTFFVPETIGPAAPGGRNTISATGSMYPTSSPCPVGTVGSDMVIISGQIFASSEHDGAAPPRAINAVLSQVAKPHVTHLAGGMIVATSSQGNDLRLDVGDTGAVVINHGTIQSVNGAAVDPSRLTLGSKARRRDTGLIGGHPRHLMAAGVATSQF